MSLYPKITIVTPCLNQAKYLECTLRSVVEQNYPNLEYIVMDGGSTDGSVEIIKKYADRLSYWESAKDKGQADAIFRGFERASGEIIGWVNSDDLLLPGSLDKVGRYFTNHPDEDFVVGGCIIIGPDGKPLRSSFGLPACNLGSRITFHKLLMWGCGCNQPASFWRKKAFFTTGGFDRSLQFSFDYDMYFRLASRGLSGRIKEFLACFRSHPESKTSIIYDIRDKENHMLWLKYGKYEYSLFYRLLMNRLYQISWILRNYFLQIQLIAGLKKVPI